MLPMRSTTFRGARLELGPEHTTAWRVDENRSRCCRSLLLLGETSLQRVVNHAHVRVILSLKLHAAGVAFQRLRRVQWQSQSDEEQQKRRRQVI